VFCVCGGSECIPECFSENPECFLYAVVPIAKRSVSVTIRSVLCVSVGSDHTPEWFQCQSECAVVPNDYPECFSENPECIIVYAVDPNAHRSVLVKIRSVLCLLWI
jgi:hypothetical protein